VCLRVIGAYFRRVYFFPAVIGCRDIIPAPPCVQAVYVQFWPICCDGDLRCVSDQSLSGRQHKLYLHSVCPIRKSLDSSLVAYRRTTLVQNRKKPNHTVAHTRALAVSDCQPYQKQYRDIGCIRLSYLEHVSESCSKKKIVELNWARPLEVRFLVRCAEY